MTWKQEKLQAQLIAVEAVKDYVVVSGGLAWHLMSPPHIEKKTVHDHSDVDLFIKPEYAQTVISILKGRGFQRYWTKYDRISDNFMRYGLTSEIPTVDPKKPKRVKVLLDLFIEEVPSRQVGGFNVITPEALLPMYETKHASKECTAVKAATRLVARGIDPLGRKELIDDG
jgi:hypothetical protein